VELLELIRVEPEIAEGALDLVRRENAEPVTLGDQGPHLRELLDFSNRHGSGDDTPIDVSRR
jgi:hypothetical protein